MDGPAPNIPGFSVRLSVVGHGMPEALREFAALAGAGEAPLRSGLGQLDVTSFGHVPEAKRAWYALADTVAAAVGDLHDLRDDATTIAGQLGTAAGVCQAGDADATRAFATLPKLLPDGNGSAP